MPKYLTIANFGHPVYKLDPAMLYIILYYIILYYIILYCIVLYCIVLYCVVLYCIVLYHNISPVFSLVAKAAAQRFASNSAAAAAAASASTSSGSSTSGSSFPSTTTQAIPSLTQLAIRLLTSRLCDARVPLLSLGGVPADVAGKIFEHLVKEKLLRPRTLQPFVPWYDI